VGPVVVADQVQVQLGIAPRQRSRKTDELQRGVPSEKPSVDFPAGHFQGGEQAGRAVAGVVMSPAGRQSGPPFGKLRAAHRQKWLATVKRLNLTLLIHTQHQRPLRRAALAGLRKVALTTACSLAEVIRRGDSRPPAACATEVAGAQRKMRHQARSASSQSHPEPSRAPA
jgi:hypothetical protein